METSTGGQGRGRVFCEEETRSLVAGDKIKSREGLDGWMKMQINVGCRSGKKLIVAD